MSDGPSGVDYLSVDDLLEIAAGVLERVDVRDLGLLASAVARPASTVFGRRCVPSVPREARRTPALAGAKSPTPRREQAVGVVGARVFCLMNGRDLRVPIDEAEAMMLAVAAGALAVPELAVMLERYLNEP